MIIGKYLIENLQPEIRNPKSAIQNPQSKIRNSNDPYRCCQKKISVQKDRPYKVATAILSRRYERKDCA
jgi:hypothetical protein